MSLTLTLTFLAFSGLAESDIAKQALKEEYGFTENTFAFFMQISDFDEKEGASPDVKQISFVPTAHLENIGVYTVNLSPSTGEVLDMAWSLENSTDTSVWSPRTAERLLAYGANAEYMPQTTTEVADYAQEDSPVFQRVTTFGSVFPKTLQAILSEHGYESYGTVRGAMLQDAYWENENAPFRTEALVALEKDGQPILVALRHLDSKRTFIFDMGPQAILSGGEYTISYSGYLTGGRARGFSITCPRLDGGSDTYTFMQAYVTDAWEIDSITRLNAAGKGLFIDVEMDITRTYGYQVFEIAPDTEDRFIGFYPYYGTFLVDALDRPITFPTSLEEAIAQSKASLEHFAKQNIALNFGVNLREKPTGKSKSLGMLESGLPLEVLGQSPGSQAPWYHIRIGNLEGYISGTHLQTSPRNKDGSLKSDNIEELFRVFGDTLHTPVPIARSMDTIRLRKTMLEHGVVDFEFPKNTLMHVIAESEDGWLYVMVPRDKIGWEVDTKGSGGYVRAEDVKIYPTALQAQLDMP